MRLKSIRLAGFKSFVEPTKIPFPQQLTGIVGPNGCGKSNVIDAVRWVLGESSARNLRGDAMTDVIFNGSTGRAAASKASVELVFDNQSGRLGGEYGAYNEVSVRREVTRDGQNLYFLNGARCRKRDITDLFLGTGLGPRSYAIIEQGMISRLIESKPQELRVFIDEAAEVSKYKERRRETENRIRHTEENMLRLTDIESELTQQVNKLRIQAQAAMKFRQLRESQRQLQRQQALAQLSQLDRALDQKESSQQEHLQQLELAAAQVTQTENQQLLLSEQQSELTEQMDQLRQQESTTAAELARCEQQLLHQQQGVQQRQQQRERLQQRLQQWRQECQERVQHQPAHQAELEQLEQQLEISEQQQEELEGQLADAEQQRLQAAESLRQFQQNFQQRSQQLVALSEQHRSALEQQQQAQTRLAELEQQQQQLQSQTSSEPVDELEVQQELLAEELASAQQQIEQSQQQLTGDKKEQERIAALKQSVSQQLFERKTQLQSQTQLLKSLTDHQYQAHSPLKDHLEITTGWEIAAEKVLGSWLFAETAPEDAPNATFSLFGDYSLQQDDPAFLNYYVKGAPAFLVAGIKVAETKAQAIAMRAELADGESVVTREGLRFGPTWNQEAQGEQSESVLTLQNFIEELTHQLPELEQHLSELDSQHEQLQQRVHQSGQQLQQQQAMGKAREQQLAELKQRLALARQQQAYQQQQLQQLAVQTEREEQSLTEASTLQAQLAEQLEILQEQVELQQEQQLGLESQVQMKEQQKQQQSAQLREAESQQHQWQLRQQQLNSELNQLAAWLSDRQQQMTEIEAQLATLSEIVDENVSEHTLSQQIEQLRQQQLERQQQREQLEGQRQKLQQQQVQLAATLKKHQQAKESLQQQQQQQQLARQELLTKRGLLAENLAQMGVSLAEADWQQVDLTVDYVAELEKIERQLKRLGAVNLAAEEEYTQQQQRLSELTTQLEDLRQALEMLNNAIAQIDRKTRSQFRETFDKVNADLQHLFPQVFGGGTAWLELTEENNLLETGVTIMARPPGKKNSTISLLSGGEKALTALSLVFAIFRLNPAPFCMLDEVDAPLDEVNVGRFADLIARMSETVQFIFISHNRVTMEKADQLAGVTMQEPGVSRLVAVDIAQAVALAE